MGPSAAVGKADASPAGPSRPNPVIVAEPRRRTFTADYKRRILDEADAGEQCPLRDPEPTRLIEGIG